MEWYLKVFISFTRFSPCLNLRFVQRNVKKSAMNSLASFTVIYPYVNPFSELYTIVNKVYGFSRKSVLMGFKIFSKI